MRMVFLLGALGASGCDVCGLAQCHANLTIEMPLGTNQSGAEVEVCRRDFCYPPAEITTSEDLHTVDEEGVYVHLSLVRVESQTELHLVADYGMEREQGQIDPPRESWYVSVQTESGPRTRYFYPEYEESEVNGEGCPPLCYNAVIRDEL